MSEKPDVIFVRVSPEVKNELKQLAISDRRPLSQYIRVILEKHIDEVRNNRAEAE